MEAVKVEVATVAEMAVATAVARAEERAEEERAVGKVEVAKGGRRSWHLQSCRRHCHRM